MTIQEYIAKLNALKQRAESRFDSLGSLEHDMLDAGYDFLLQNLEFSDGAFDVPADLPKLMDDFVFSIVSVAEKSKDYNNAFSDFLADLNVINKNIEEFQSTYNRVTTKKPGIKQAQKAVIGEVIKQYKGNGLNVHFAQPLRELMYGNVLSGMNQKEAKQYLSDYILSGKDGSGKLQQYLTQTAQQGVDSYSGAINMKLQAEYDYTGYVISGSIIATSSKQCKQAIELSQAGYLTFEQWKKILEVAKNNASAKLIDGTTIDNLPLNKLHWGCRHEFTPVIKN